MTYKIEEYPAAVGEKIGLVFEGTHAMTGSVIVTFSVFLIEPKAATSPAVPIQSWQETLLVVSSDPADKQGRIRTLVHWIAGVEHSKSNVPETNHAVSVTATGTTSSGSNITSTSSTTVRIPGIRLTSDPSLHEIMIHEFSRQKTSHLYSAEYEYDPEPAKAFIASLTPLQRSILAKYPRNKGRNDRLVAFITLKGPQRDKPLFADNGKINGKWQWAIANAEFSVFHCANRDSGITLVCHTQHFCMNFHNPGTQTFFQSMPEASLSRIQTGSANRPRYLLASSLERFTGGQVYNSVLKTNGESVMGANFLHGMVNTHGCWMLFKNFNWPTNLTNSMFRIYLHLRDSDTPSGVAAAKTALGNLSPGYDADSSQTHSSSYDKFLRWDRNYAIGFFYDRVLGLKFLSKRCGSWKTHVAIGESIDTTNLRHTHGRIFEKQFPFADRFPAGNPDGMRFHDWFEQNPKSVAIPKSIWGINAMGFQTASGSRGQGDPESCSWADLYFFLGDGITKSEASRPVYLDLNELP